MSRASVRSAVVAWFAPPNVTFLQSLDSAQHKITQGQQFHMGLPAGQSGAVGWVYVMDQMEYRAALGGPQSGKKIVSYRVAVDIRFVSNQVTMSKAWDDHDTLIDSFCARLRAGRTLGDNSNANGQDGILQAGEGNLSSGEEPDINVHTNPGFIVGDGVPYISSYVDFLVKEVITT